MYGIYWQWKRFLQYHTRDSTVEPLSDCNWSICIVRCILLIVTYENLEFVACLSDPVKRCGTVDLRRALLPCLQRCVQFGQPVERTAAGWRLFGSEGLSRRAGPPTCQARHQKHSTWRYAQMCCNFFHILKFFVLFWFVFVFMLSSRAIQHVSHTCKYCTFKNKLGSG